MPHTLTKALINTRLMRRFMSMPSPQWMVFIIDMLIVAASTFITLTFNPIESRSAITWLSPIAIKGLILLAIYAASMLAIKPYRSIVRLSTFEDSYRIVITVCTASVIAEASEWALTRFFDTVFIGSWNIFVIGVFCISMFMLVRLAVKYVFRVASNAEHKRRRVIVLGSGFSSFAMASALLNEVDGQFNPVLMLSLNTPTTSDTRVNDIPIKHYNPDTIGRIFENYNCDTLIFLSSQIEFMRSGAADVFLSNHIKLLMLNQIEEFDINNNSHAVSTLVQNIKIEDLLGREPIVTGNPVVAGSLRNKTVLVTGAAGSIGSEIVRQVCIHGCSHVVLVDQAETPMHEMQLELEKLQMSTKISICIADVANNTRMSSIFDLYRPNIVYHAAAYKHVPMMERNPLEAVNTNILGTKNIADLSLRFGAEKFVMISTDKAVNPTNIMGASKRIAEIYVQSLAIKMSANGQRATRFITTRFGNVLGSNGSVIPLFRKQITEGGPVTVTHRDIIRYFMTIPEACSLVLEAGCMGHGGEIFIFDMGNPIKIYDLARRMISLAGLRPDVDIKIVETGLRPGEKLYEELLNNHETTIATHHKKIMIAKVRTYDYDEVVNRLRLLKYACDTNDVHDAVMQMKCMVPEYKSQNSVFETIDDEIKPCDIIKEINPN